MGTETADAQDIRKQFEQAGFTVANAAAPPGALEVRKDNCLCNIELKAGRWVRSGPPLLVAGGIRCELEDRGYQKFWYSRAEGRRFPIRRVELDTLRRFDDEVRYILGLKTLYHESLGTTNARTVYDRLTGRPDR